VLGVMVAAGAAQASTVERKNLQIFNDVAAAVNGYERYTIFDDVSVGVNNGIVTLTGKVTMPLKREELAKRVAKVNGVQRVLDELSVLPLSPTDDRLRYQIARSIYRNENFPPYVHQFPGPIHIIVENGNVTLTGVVANDMDRQMAYFAARQYPAFSVTNHLKTDAEARHELEKL
jgi:hyperosmotically inducible protein